MASRMAQSPLKPQNRTKSKRRLRRPISRQSRGAAGREVSDAEASPSAFGRWRIIGPLNPAPTLPYSDRIERLLERAAELDKEADSASTDDQRRTIEAFATLYEGTARSFAHLEAFRVAVNKDLMSD